MFPASTNGGGSCLAFPDVCKTPAPPAPFVPIPYPNTCQLTQIKGDTASSKVKILNKKTAHKNTIVSRSMGDEAGTLKGLVSQKNMDQVKRTAGVSNVKIEGIDIVTVLKPTAHNGSNANAPGGAQLAPSQSKVIIS
jgi:hypothetical protein